MASLITSNVQTLNQESYFEVLYQFMEKLESYRVKYYFQISMK